MTGPYAEDHRLMPPALPVARERAQRSEYHALARVNPAARGMCHLEVEVWHNRDGDTAVHTDGLTLPRPEDWPACAGFVLLLAGWAIDGSWEYRQDSTWRVPVEPLPPG